MSLQLKDRVLAAVPIESYIGRYVRLKPSGSSGKSLQGLCPFHKEKTPSFTVSPNKGLFYCFGCNKGGDLFRFVMEREGLPFSQALKLLARHAAIPFESSEKRTSKKETQLLEVNEKVMQTFRDFLKSPQAKTHKEYLRKRGINEESIEFFNLGASPEPWDWLRGNYRKYEKELLELGLLRQKEKSRSPYDFFRNRIIFPILSLDKKPLGFGGRSLPGQDKEAKYMNSPDSPLFKKSRLLYGLSQNVRELASRQEALLVEGYLDVIALWQVGLAYACAPLGTALSMEHLRLLSSYVKSVSFIFDGDEAGLEAARRAVTLNMKGTNLEAYVCILPLGRDPFDLCASASASQLALLLERRIKSSDFFLMESLLPRRFQKFQNEEKNLLQKGDLSDFAKASQNYYRGAMPALLPKAMQKREALDRLYENLAEFAEDTDRRLFLEGAARVFKLDPLELQQEWNKRYKKKNYSPLYSTSPRTEDSIFQENFSRDSHRDSHRNFPREGPPLGNSNPEKDPQRGLKPYGQNLIHCERQLLLELLFHPSVFEHFYEKLDSLRFEDPHSESLWRHLDWRYRKGKIWDKDRPMDLELAEESHGIFSALIAKSQFEKNKRNTNSKPHSKAKQIDPYTKERRSYEESEESKESKEIIRDYLLKHDILQHEKNIDKIGSCIPVADLLQKSRLIAKEGELIRELNHLKSKWRSRRGAGENHSA